MRPPYSVLIDSARNRDDITVLAFAGVMSMARSRPSPYNVPIAGVDRSGMQVLVERYFPTLDPAPWVETIPSAGWTDTARLDEFQDLVDLLNGHISYHTEECRWVALAIATASMGANHLWQDMGLPNRRVLSSLIEENFTSLFIRNVGDMKWKKFFYRQLCEKAEVLICKSPSCGICIDFNVCFGKDELSVPGHFTIEPEHAHR
jgi:nitrogen fixation protein NifQ